SAIASMLNVALTGNIAAGKSTVVELFRRWGATIVDADELVRQAQAPGGEVLAAIVRRFGSDVLASDGSLDRAALRSKVMGDQAALDALNAIVHPAVRRRRDHRAPAARERRRVPRVHDIPPALAALRRPAQSLLLAADEAAGAGDASEHPALMAIAGRYSDAGLAVRRVAGGSAVEKALARVAARPDAIVATAAAAAEAERAWE